MSTCWWQGWPKYVNFILCGPLMSVQNLKNSAKCWWDISVWTKVADWPFDRLAIPKDYAINAYISIKCKISIHILVMAENSNIIENVFFFREILGQYLCLEQILKGHQAYNQNYIFSQKASKQIIYFAAVIWLCSHHFGAFMFFVPYSFWQFLCLWRVVVCCFMLKWLQGTFKWFIFLFSGANLTYNSMEQALRSLSIIQYF